MWYELFYTILTKMHWNIIDIDNDAMYDFVSVILSSYKYYKKKQRQLIYCI